MDQAAGEHAVVWVPFRMKDETLGAMRLADALASSPVRGGRAVVRAGSRRARRHRPEQRPPLRPDRGPGHEGRAHAVSPITGASTTVSPERSNAAGATTRPSALLMLDIDDFKQLNDTYGHPAGRRGAAAHRPADDRRAPPGAATWRRATAAKSSASSSRTRPPQAAWRGASGRSPRSRPWPAGHEEGAAALAERLRRRIAASDFPVGPDGAPVRLTVSIGVAAFPATAGDMDTLVGNARRGALLGEALRQEHGPGVLTPPAGRSASLPDLGTPRQRLALPTLATPLRHTNAALVAAGACRAYAGLRKGASGEGTMKRFILAALLCVCAILFAEQCARRRIQPWRVRDGRSVLPAGGQRRLRRRSLRPQDRLRTGRELVVRQSDHQRDGHAGPVGFDLDLVGFTVRRSRSTGHPPRSSGRTGVGRHACCGHP